MNSQRWVFQSKNVTFKRILNQSVMINFCQMYVFFVCCFNFSYVAGCPTSLQLFMKMIDDLCGMADDELELIVE